MAASIKTILFLSVFVLAGAGIVSRFVYRELWPAGFARIMRVSSGVSAVLLIAATAADLAATVHGVLGFLELDLLLNYFQSTAHGTWSAVRAGAVLLLSVVAFVPPLEPRPSGAERWGTLAGNILFLAGFVLLLVSFSRISHNAAMGGWLPIPADLIHLLAAVSWGATALYLAFLPIWTDVERPALESAMQRLSRLGVSAVVLLFISGTYSGFLHISTIGGLTGTIYGQSLIVKVLLVLVITAVAAVNRQVLLPRLQRGGPSRQLRSALRAEALVLLGVLAVTGLLTVSPMPH